MGQIWRETDPRIISNGVRTAGIYPYTANVFKKQYDSLILEKKGSTKWLQNSAGPSTQDNNGKFRRIITEEN